jgi:diguanylate cyclase (GGDEF)-like protein
MLDRQATDSVATCLVRRLKEERYDSLTGLMTEDVMLARADSTIRRREEPGSALVGFADGDRVKEANDLHGHQAGDEGISGIGSEIVACLRLPESLVARRTRGSDEFEFIVFDVEPDAVQVITERLGSRLASIEVVVNGLTIIVGATIAVKYLERVHSIQDIRRALHEADMAVNALKKHGRGRD